MATHIYFFIKKTAKVEQSQGLILTILPTRHDLTLIIYVCVCKEVLYVSSHYSPSILWEEVVLTLTCKAGCQQFVFWGFY